MNTAHLVRYYSDDDVTLGNLHIQGVKHKPIFTLENPWRNNERSVSCIPVGKYDCESFSGMKHRNCYQICNVKDRTYILIHKGNYANDTQGCILVGRCVALRGCEYMVTSSQATMRLLKELLKEEPFMLNLTYQYHIGE
jgi:hypothetical protein